MFVPKGRAINPITKTNWERTGVEPDIRIQADQALDRAQREALVVLLAKEKVPEWRQELEEAKEKLEKPSAGH